jgi:O-antigen ligase
LLRAAIDRKPEKDLGGRGMVTNGLQSVHAGRGEFLRFIPLFTIFGGVLLGLAIVLRSFSVSALAGSLVLLGVLVLFLLLPGSVVPAMILTIPLEISKTFFPILLLDRDVEGHPASILDLSRIVLALGAAAFLILLLMRATRVKGILSHRLTGATVAFLAFCSLQVALIGPLRPRALIEIGRLAAHVMLLIITASFLDSIKRLTLALKSFLVCGIGLAAVGIYQYMTGSLFWNEFRLTLGGFTRINATFADPNIYARYLATVVLVSLALRDSKFIGKKLLALSIGMSLPALLFTYSRSGWLLLPAGLFVLWVFSTGKLKMKLTWRAIALVGLAGLMVLSSALLRSRAETFSAGLGSLGQRLDLINTGIEMYRDHKALGVGFGAFEDVALREYREFLPYGGRHITLSHTALVTVLAELGTLGMLLTLGIFVAAFLSFRTVWRLQKVPHASLALSCFVAIVVIVLSAQSEGRMFEEPMLWVFMGMLIAIERVGRDEPVHASSLS